MSLAANLLAEVNGSNPGVGSSHANQYGNYLLNNFNDLWIKTNKFNAESILEVSHSSQNSYWGNWGGNSDEGNTICVMVGPRSYTLLNSSRACLPCHLDGVLTYLLKIFTILYLVIQDLMPLFLT